jgi:hypothetical protein
VVKKPLNAEKNKMSEIYETPEGFVLAIRKTPKGTEVIRKVTIGTLRRCWGSAATRSDVARTKNTALATRIMIVDQATSLLANQLMPQ